MEIVIGLFLGLLIGAGAGYAYRQSVAQKEVTSAETRGSCRGRATQGGHDERRPSTGRRAPLSNTSVRVTRRAPFVGRPGQAWLAGPYMGRSPRGCSAPGRLVTGRSRWIEAVWDPGGVCRPSGSRLATGFPEAATGRI